MTHIHLSNYQCITDLLKIKKINKNMEKYVYTQIHFFENILMEISNKKNKYIYKYKY